MIVDGEGGRLERAYQTALAALLAERTPEGHWVGELSTSALSTATAVSALALVQKATPIHGAFGRQIAGGLAWLAGNQNADGGWGDTVKSFSNISTTMLCRAAFHLTGAGAGYADCLGRAEAWLHGRYGKTPEELAEAVRSMRDCDFVLIDTAGRSPKDALKLNELRTFLEAAQPEEVHLVLSTTADRGCLDLAIEKFSNVRVDKLIFTKLDEAPHVGTVLTMVKNVGKPLSYVTTGQGVPADIEVAKGKRIAQLILGSEL